MATRGSYVHISMGIILGGIPIKKSMLVLCKFLRKNDGFEQKDSQGFENSYNSYEQNLLEKIFIFTIYQNYTLALKVLRPIFRPKFWSCVNLIISKRMITKNFSGREKVRNGLLFTQQCSLLLSSDGSTFHRNPNYH